MHSRLTALREEHAVIGDLRGRGAMMAIELCTPGTTDPDPARTAAVSAYCHQQGVVTLTCGTYGNVFRFLPPLSIPDALLDEALRRGRRGVRRPPPDREPGQRAPASPGVSAGEPLGQVDRDRRQQDQHGRDHVDDRRLVGPEQVLEDPDRQRLRRWRRR